MSALDGFRAFNFNEGVPYVSVTSNGMTFNKAVIMKLGYPEHVVLLIDDENKRIAIQVCEEEAPNSVSFFKQNNIEVFAEPKMINVPIAFLEDRSECVATSFTEPV